MGLTLPPLQEMLFAGLGFIAPPMVEGFASRFLPASISSSTAGRYGVRIASVLALGWGTKQLIGAKEARNVLLGGAVYVIGTAASEFLPSLTGGGVNAYVTPTRALPSLREYTQSNQPTYMPMQGTRAAGRGRFGR